MDSAILRVNDQPPKEWNVFREGKKTDALILQIEHRFLLIEIRGQRVRDLDIATLKRYGGFGENRRERSTGKSAGHFGFDFSRYWTRRCESIFKLTAESRTVDLELPQWINRGVTY